MFQRPYYKILKNRIVEEHRKTIQVILGPRQVGKTTLVRQFLESTSLCWHYASADAVVEHEKTWISSHWETARIKMRMEGAGEGLLVLDEVQKIPDWSEYVKKEWDADSLHSIPLKVILLGSSAMMIKKGLSESLAGRFEQILMGHWSFPEMREAFGYDLENYIWFGGYPGAATLINEESRWASYIRDSLIETAILKDVVNMTRIDKPALMRRLFDLGCHYSAQIISYTKILGQLQDAGNTTTLAHYLDLLGAAGMMSGLQKFTEGVARQRGSSPKFQVHNNALISAIQPYSKMSIRLQPERWGRWVESAVGAHLINFSLDGGYSVFYWRQGDAEVDYVLQSGQHILAIEVKSGSKQRRYGLDAFNKAYPKAKTLFVGGDGLPPEAFFDIHPSELIC